MPGVVETIIAVVATVAAVVVAAAIGNEIHQALFPSQSQGQATSITPAQDEGEDPAQFLAWLPSVFDPWRATVDSALGELRGLVHGIQDLVTQTIQPALNAMRPVLDALQIAHAITSGRVDQLVRDVYGKLFPGLDALQQQIRQVAGDLERTVGVVDQKLSNRIQDLEQRVNGAIASKASDLRDELLKNIREVTEPLNQRITQIENAIQPIVQRLDGRIDGLTGALGRVFDSTGALTRGALNATLGKWGDELLNDLLGRVAGTVSDADRRTAEAFPGEPVTEWVAFQILRGGEWRDLDRYLGLWKRHIFGELIPDEVLERSWTVDPTSELDVPGMASQTFESGRFGPEEPPVKAKTPEEISPALPVSLPPLPLSLPVPALALPPALPIP